MKVSKKAYYGLRAALALAHAHKPLSIHALAEGEHLPEGYLEKILQTLRRAGIVAAEKGVAGGYALARSVDTLTVWDILSVLDGPLKTIAPAGSGGLPCSLPSHCQANEAWRLLGKEIEDTLSRITIGSLIPRNKRL
jgi:Rrf2 family transcriptional regulator, cysteine metabolism repressor